MKGLMFNNKYGLEDAVLNGTKTMTRRNVSNKLIINIKSGLRTLVVLVFQKVQVMKL